MDLIYFVIKKNYYKITYNFLSIENCIQKVDTSYYNREYIVVFKNIKHTEFYGNTDVTLDRKSIIIMINLL